MKVALVCIAKNEDNYITEWVNYHKKIGFDSIFIYENNWSCSIEDPNVTKIRFDGKPKQRESYNHFYENSNDFDWVAFFDVDEFLVLKKHKDVKDFLKDYEDYLSVGINWVLFGDNGINHVGDDYNVIKRFTKRQIGVDPHIKSIVNLNRCRAKMGVHSPQCKWVDPDKILNEGPYNKNGNDNIAQINHYFCKTKDEFINKIERGRSDNGKFRDISDFDPHNKNEVLDLNAYNFFIDDNNNILNT
jgi:hypothetical protein